MCSVGCRVQAVRPAKRQRRAHQLQEIAAALHGLFIRAPADGLLRELPLQQVLELRASPPGRPGCASIRARERLPAGSARTAARSNFLRESLIDGKWNNWSACARPECCIPSPAGGRSSSWSPVGLVAHCGDELARPDILFGVAVTVEAPLHLQRVLLPGERHLVHSAMATLAADALVDVNAVIEIDEIRQIVDARPPDRFAGAETGAHRFQRRAGDPDLRVAVHAGLGGRNVGEAGSLHRGVAIAAIDPDRAHVVRMAERNGLFPRLRGARGHRPNGSDVRTPIRETPE